MDLQNERQTDAFFRTEQRGSAQSELSQSVYETVMIDQGFCFNAGEWTFPDAPLRGLYARNRVYLGVTGRESFEPWIEAACPKLIHSAKNTTRHPFPN